MIAAFPATVQIVLLAILGGLLGSLINYAIYAWPVFVFRPISPWQARPPQVPPRKILHFLPIAGWWNRTGESEWFGRGFWLRPMLIEIVWTIGLPCFYLWLRNGGLLGQPIDSISSPWSDWPQTVEIWFWSQTSLLALMTIATFIDFDERTIPDQITIPGTLLALCLAALFPQSRLPEMTSTLAGISFDPLFFANGTQQPLLGVTPELFRRGVIWHQTSLGLWIGLGIFLGWILALVPKRCTLRYGWKKGLWLMWASCLRPARKTACPLRTRERHPLLETKLLCWLALLGIAGILLAKRLLPEENWDSLFCALFGLGFGGLTIWSVRLVGGQALGKEVMGFGDVTLMAMVGAFLGWQTALLALPVASLLALGIAIFSTILTGDTRLAFGPYLCLGTALILFNWGTLWPSLDQYFSLGEWLFVILGVMLAMMWAMLAGLSWLKAGGSTG
jgi:leader peptidase (prepilin peptidase)/N-methyltransferase